MSNGGHYTKHNSSTLDKWVSTFIPPKMPTGAPKVTRPSVGTTLSVWPCGCYHDKYTYNHHMHNEHFETWYECEACVNKKKNAEQIRRNRTEVRTASIVYKCGCQKIQDGNDVRWKPCDECAGLASRRY